MDSRVPEISDFVIEVSKPVTFEAHHPFRLKITTAEGLQIEIPIRPNQAVTLTPTTEMAQAVTVEIDGEDAPTKGLRLVKG